MRDTDCRIVVVSRYFDFPYSQASNLLESIKRFGNTVFNFILKLTYSADSYFHYVVGFRNVCHHPSIAAIAASHSPAFWLIAFFSVYQFIEPHLGGIKRL